MYSLAANRVASRAVVAGARPVCKALAPLRTRQSARSRSVVVRAEQTDDASAKLQEQLNSAVTFVKDQWEKTADAEKPAAVAIIIGAVLAQIAIGATVDAVDRIPLIKQFLEFVGLAVSVTYGYRYFTDPSERENLKSSVDSFVKAVTGK